MGGWRVSFEWEEERKITRSDQRVPPVARRERVAVDLVAVGRHSMDQ